MTITLYIFLSFVTTILLTIVKYFINKGVHILYVYLTFLLRIFSCVSTEWKGLLGTGL